MCSDESKTNNDDDPCSRSKFSALRREGRKQGGRHPGFGTGPELNIIKTKEKPERDKMLKNKFENGQKNSKLKATSFPRVVSIE